MKNINTKPKQPIIITHRNNMKMHFISTLGKHLTIHIHSPLLEDRVCVCVCVGRDVYVQRNDHLILFCHEKLEHHIRILHLL